MATIRDTSALVDDALLAVYHHVNDIWHDQSQSLSMNFDGEQDTEIGRQNQARLTCDPKGNVFCLQYGEDANLTCLNDQPVLELQKLNPYDRITIGFTTVVFVPFCGESFQGGLD